MYGMAPINVKPGSVPKRQRCFQMVGERADAVKQIIAEYVMWTEVGWNAAGVPLGYRWGTEVAI